MGNTLARAIDALNAPSVALPDGLRGLLIVATRMKSVPLKNWLRSELHGYVAEDKVPSYREDLQVAVRMRFEGYAGMSSTIDLRPFDIPERLRAITKGMDLRQSTAEIETLVQGNADSMIKLPACWVQQYRNLAEEGKAIGVEMMVLNDARILISRNALMGMLDSIRTFAIEMALDVEGIAPEAGEAGGPTVDSDPELARSVDMIVNNIYGDVITAQGDSVNVASGAGAVAVQLSNEGMDALLEKARHYLTEESVGDLEEALLKDGKSKGRHTDAFLERLKNGSVSLLNGVVVSGAYDGIKTLFSMAADNGWLLG